MDVHEAALAQDAPEEFLALRTRQIQEHKGSDAGVPIVLMVHAQRVEARAAEGSSEPGAAAEDLEAVAVNQAAWARVRIRGTTADGHGR